MALVPLEVLEASSEPFLAYGRLVSSLSRPPDFACPEFQWWSRLGLPSMEGPPSVGVVESLGRAHHRSTVFERHGRTSETLIPVDADVVLVVARDAPRTDGALDPASVRAFRLRRGEAAVLHAGTWHYAPLTAAPRARTFVVFDHRTSEEDVVKIDSEDEFGVVFAVETP